MNATQPTPAASSASGTFEPRIVAFVCKWCTYAGADLAGTSRMVYPSNVRTLMLPCTGRIDISFVLRAFLQGADGVLVSGCHPGDCHYVTGNFRARRRWMILRDLLDTLGVDLRRLDMAWISAAEGAKWVKTVQSFTAKIKDLGPYTDMQKVAADRAPEIAAAMAEAKLSSPGNGHPQTAEPADPQLIAAANEALSGGKVKTVIGWVRNGTLGRPRPVWMNTADETAKMVSPGDNSANLARFLKNPGTANLLPLGIVARSCEMAALNVLVQEAQIDPANVVVLAIGPDGKFRGAMDLSAAATSLVDEVVKAMPADRPVGFSDSVLKALDELMAKTPQERWAFWSQQSAKCIKCYACRGSCPLCSCDQCFVDKNQPQWFPTAADGPGNFSWHVIRTFHLAGRCIGCGACQDACPAGIPLNLLGAAVARSALKQFGHRSGTDPKAVPLQSDYKAADQESFIL